MEKANASGNLRTASINAFLTGLAFNVMRAVWQPFVLSLGAPMSALGLLESLGGYRGLFTGPLQYVSGWFSDRLGRKPLIALGNLAGLLASALYVIAALSGNWYWLFPAVILTGASMMGDPAQYSLVAESTHISQRGMAFSVLMLAWIAPGIFAPALGGYAADHWGFAPVFVLQVVLFGLALVLILRYLRETLSPVAGSIDWRAFGAAMVKMAAPPRNLRGLYLAMSFDSFLWGIGYALLYGMLSETYGFTTFQLGIMSSLLSVTWALFQLPVGKLIDRYGSKPLIVFSEALSIPIVVGWLVFTSFPAFAVMHAVFGLIAATWVPAQNALLANSVPEQGRAEALGRMAAFRGLVGFPAPFLGGLLYDAYGFQGPMVASLVGVVIATILLIVVVREPPRGEEGVGEKG